ncbi:MAG: hypothetical protein R2795_06185 [Saprospiraceae bacterium]
MIRDPVADYTSQDVQLEASVPCRILQPAIPKEVFSSEVSIKQGTVEGAYQAFYGQKMSIAGNDVDSILVGVTNNLISRIEVWHQV